MEENVKIRVRPLSENKKEELRTALNQYERALELSKGNVFPEPIYQKLSSTLQQVYEITGELIIDAFENERKNRVFRKAEVYLDNETEELIYMSYRRLQEHKSRNSDNCF